MIAYRAQRRYIKTNFNDHETENNEKNSKIKWKQIKQIK